MGKSVLVIEDDQDVAYSVKEVLATDGFDVTISANGRDAIPILQKADIDLVVVDINLPDLNGLDLLKTLDAARPFGVIVLTGRTDVIDTVLGLELGADDYITKPFEPRVFVARVRSVLRRCGRRRVPAMPDRATVHFRGWTYDDATRSVARAGEKKQKLTASESRLLKVLIGSPNVILSRDRILDLLHPTHSDLPYDRSIDVTVTRLRRKIEIDARRPRFIKTAHGDGYFFDPKGE